MIRANAPPAPTWKRIPRESGDDPHQRLLEAAMPVYSPRERG